MASVLLCQDERLDRLVAVKRLHADSPEDVEKRFVREAKLGASLNHPNLVSVYDTAVDDEGVLIVMEYVPGEPLSRALRQGPLGPHRVGTMASEIGAALDHAHDQGVVHRDVKPGNVLLRNDGVSKLVDLGIATAADGTRITRSGTVLGTAAYMAPEQLEGREPGPAVDIYALAAVCFEALAGRKPRDGTTPLQIAHSIASDPPPDLREHWPAAPPAVAELLARGMARDPDERPRSAGRMGAELARALDQPPEPPTAPTRRVRRAAAEGERRRGSRRLPVIVAGLILALAVAVAAVAFGSGGDDDPAGGRGAETADKADKADKADRADKAKNPKENGSEQSAQAQPAPTPAPEPEPEPAPQPEAEAPADGGGNGAAGDAGGAELNQQGFDLLECRPLRRGDSGAPTGRAVVPGRHERSQLRLRAVQSRQGTPPRRPPGGGDPDPRAAPRVPQPDRSGAQGVGARPAGRGRVDRSCAAGRAGCFAGRSIVRSRPSRLLRRDASGGDVQFDMNVHTGDSIRRGPIGRNGVSGGAAGTAGGVAAACRRRCGAPLTRPCRGSMCFQRLGKARRMSETDKPGATELKELMGRVLDSDAADAFAQFMIRHTALGDMAPNSDEAVIDGIEESPDGGAGMAEAHMLALPDAEREELQERAGRETGRRLHAAAVALLAAVGAARLPVEVTPEMVAVAAITELGDYDPTVRGTP